MSPLGTDHLERLYTEARAHGLGHEAALKAVSAGELCCWCGNPNPCRGGAQRFVGCPTPMSAESPIPLNFTHTRHRGDAR